MLRAEREDMGGLRVLIVEVPREEGGRDRGVLGIGELDGSGGYVC